MNKKAQSVITIGLALLVIGLAWLLGLAGWIGQTAGSFVAANNITGFEGFFYTNINLWIGFFYILAWVVLGRLA